MNGVLAEIIGDRFRQASPKKRKGLLRAMLGRVRVRSFEVKAPTLHEIFVRLVGTDDEQDS